MSSKFMRKKSELYFAVKIITIPKVAKPPELTKMPLCTISLSIQPCEPPFLLMNEAFSIYTHSYIFFILYANKKSLFLLIVPL